MRLRILKAVASGILFVSTYGFIGATLSPAQCPILYAVVKGQVERPPRGATVRVQLVYSKHAKDQNGESGEVKLEAASFRMQIPFLTQSGAPILGLGRYKCDLRPKTVLVTLSSGDREYDHVSLDWAKDFKMADPGAYTLRSEIVLHGAP